MLHLYPKVFSIPNLHERTGYETLSYFNRLTSTLLFLHHHWNQWFSWENSFALTNRPGFSFKSRVFQEPSAFSLQPPVWAWQGSSCRPSLKSVCCTKHSSGTTEAAKLGMVLSLFVFPSRVWAKRCSLFWLIHFIYPLLPGLYDYFFSVKERWMLPLDRDYL